MFKIFFHSSNKNTFLRIPGNSIALKRMAPMGIYPKYASNMPLFKNHMVSHVERTLLERRVEENGCLPDSFKRSSWKEHILGFKMCRGKRRMYLENYHSCVCASGYIYVNLQTPLAEDLLQRHKWEKDRFIISQETDDGICIEFRGSLNEEPPTIFL